VKLPNNSIEVEGYDTIFQRKLCTIHAMAAIMRSLFATKMNTIYIYGFQKEIKVGYAFFFHAFFFKEWSV